MLETDNDSSPPPSARFRGSRGRGKGRGSGSGRSRQSHNSIAYNNNSDHDQVSYSPGIGTFNPNCQECTLTTRLNHNLRVKLDRLLGACRDAMERWADDVGVGTGVSMEPMEWRPEMTTLVLERVPRPAEFQGALLVSPHLPVTLLPTRNIEESAGQQQQKIQAQEQEQTGLQQQQKQQQQQQQRGQSKPSLLPHQQSQEPSSQYQLRHLSQCPLQIHLQLQSQTSRGGPTEPLANQHLLLHQQQQPQQTPPQSSSILTYPRNNSESPRNGIENLLALWDGGSSASSDPRSAGSATSTGTGTSSVSSDPSEAAHLSAQGSGQDGTSNINVSTNTNVTTIATATTTANAHDQWEDKTVDYSNLALAR